MHGWSIPVVRPAARAGAGTAVGHSLDRAALLSEGEGCRRRPTRQKEDASRARAKDRRAAQQCMSTAVTTERDLHALAADAGLTLSPQLLGVVLELLRLDVTPQALLATHDAPRSTHHAAHTAHHAPLHLQVYSWMGEDEP